MVTNACDGDRLAAVLGIAVQTVRELARRGIIERSARGAYDFDASIRGYCAHLREQAAGRASQGQYDLATERARLAKEQADAQELKNQQLRGELISATEAESEWSALMVEGRGRLLATVNAIQMELPHLTRHDLTVVDRVIRAALTAFGSMLDDEPDEASLFR